jgi:CRP-like cAMP-binding protein
MAPRSNPPADSLQDARQRLANRLSHLLAGADAATIERLAESARVRAIGPGDVIYPQGEVVPLTLILDGFGVARRTTTDGQVIMSGVATSGVVFGYSGIAGEQSSVEIAALTQGVVAQWPGTEIRALMAADAGFALAAIDSMAASLHQTVERIEGFLHQDARRRVLRILARHRELFFGEPAVLDRTHLPGLVGTTPEMTRRVLRRLEHEGTVQRVGATGLRLLRPEQLEEA